MWKTLRMRPTGDWTSDLLIRKIANVKLWSSYTQIRQHLYRMCVGVYAVSLGSPADSPGKM